MSQKKKEKCIPPALLKKGINSHACLRKDGNCCMALCSNGSRCQNKAKYQIPIGKIPVLGGTVTAMACSTFAMVPVSAHECCRICGVHAKKTSLTILKLAHNRLCTFLLNKLTSSMVRELSGGDFGSADQANKFFSMA